MRRILPATALVAAAIGGVGAPSASAHCTSNVRGYYAGHCYVNAGTCAAPYNLVVNVCPFLPGCHQ